jgi:hypothetical protein
MGQLDPTRCQQKMDIVMYMPSLPTKKILYKLVMGRFRMPRGKTEQLRLSQDRDRRTEEWL